MSVDVSAKEVEALAALMKDHRPLALIGAGASAAAGYPTWETLILKLEEKAKQRVLARGMAPKYGNFLRTLNDPAWQAEEYARSMGIPVFRKFIKSAFASKKNKISPLHQAIVRLGFRHILTTNYDPLIEEAYLREYARHQANRFALKPIQWTDECGIRQFFLDLSRSNVNPYLIYLHGRFDKPASVILTESSYAKRYAQNDEASLKLFAILMTQPVVFIGFSVNDPDLNHLMRGVNARLGSGRPRHFAIMGYEIEHEREMIQNRFSRKYGIEPVFYQIKTTTDRKGNLSKDHSELLTFLEQLYIAVYKGRIKSSNKRSSASPSLIVETPAPAGGASIDLLDPQKGQWGGESENGKRQLKVENIKCKGKAFCAFDIVLETIKNAEQLKGSVSFHLHDTFRQSVLKVEAKRGKARHMGLRAYGAFTVGAEADCGETKLELDLTEVDGFPQWFKDR